MGQMVENNHISTRYSTMSLRIRDVEALYAEGRS
jgi:hypothetical protein